MNRVLAGIGLGVLGGLGWWAPGVSLAAIPVALGLHDSRDPDAPAIWAAGALVGAAVAIGTAPWLAVPRPAEERVLLALFFGLFLAGIPRVFGAPDRTALGGALLASGFGAAMLDRWVPTGWVAGVPGILGTALGCAIPGFPFRLADPRAVPLAVAAALSAACVAGVWRLLRSERGRALWVGLAVGSALAAWPFQVASPPRLDGWWLGRPVRTADVASADPRWWPREMSLPTAGGAAGVVGGMVLGGVIGRRRAKPQGGQVQV